MTTPNYDDILEAAIAEHNPVSIVCLFSGGHDSLTATHCVMTNYAHLQPEVCHIDTGIGIPETQQFVVDACHKYRWPLSIYRAVENVRSDGTPDPMVYEDIVIQNGFPGPGAHRIMYSKLKERQLRRIVRDRKAKMEDRVLLVSGVRREESARRMGTTKEVIRNGAQVWVAPLLYFTAEDQSKYMRDHRLPRNPVKDRLCMSGECLCGAFARKGELREIEFWYPEVGRRIRALEDRVREAGHPAGWEGGKGAKKQIKPAGPLCVSCDAQYEQVENDHTQL